jgi:hypothetical protein
MSRPQVGSRTRAQDLHERLVRKPSLPSGGVRIRVAEELLEGLVGDPSAYCIRPRSVSGARVEWDVRHALERHAAGSSLRVLAA